MNSSAKSKCPWCQTEVKSAAGYCGKCGAYLEIDPSGAIQVQSDKLENTNEASVGYQFSVSTMLLVTTLVAVCVALFAAAPGLGILLSIIAVPPFIRTLMLVRRRKVKGQEVSTAAKVGLYLGSLGVTLVITYVTLIASLLTFCLSCMGVFAAGGGNNETGAFAVAILLSLAIAGLLVWAFSKWVRYRWQRDLQK